MQKLTLFHGMSVYVRMMFLCSLLQLRLASSPTWSNNASNRCNHCPAEGCHSVNISASYSYRPFPVGVQNVVLENWNYVLDRSANVTTIVVQHNGK